MADVAVFPMWGEPRRTARVFRGRSSGVDVESAFIDLAPRVLGYLRAHGASDPENLLGEVFLQVTRDFEQFSGNQADCRRWVFAVTRNRLIDSRRRSAVRPAIADSPLPDVESRATIDATIDPELVTALAKLTDDQREVVVLRFVADLSLRDVADLTGRDAGAVKALQQRGLAALQRALAADAAGPTSST